MPSLGYIQKGPKVIPNEGNNGGGGGGSDNIVIINPDNGISITPRDAIQAIIDGKIIAWDTAMFDEPITTSFAYTYFVTTVNYDIDSSTWYMHFSDGTEIISADIDEDFYID